MPITRTAQVDDDGSGTTGTIWNNAWKTELYNQIDLVEAGLLGYVNARVPEVWTAYTPLWTGSTTNPVIGNGTLAGRYALIGKTVHFIVFTLTGSTTTYGSGYWIWTLPLAVSAVPASGRWGTHFTVGILNASGTGSAPAMTYGLTATTVYAVSSVAGLVGPTIPITFNAGCSLAIRGTYETT
jgi:hypothetical protein